MICGITLVILRTMKTAISVRDNLFQRVDRFAKDKKMSRSQIFSDAAEEYLSRRETVDVTANLNEIYSKEDSSIDPVIFKMALMSLPIEEW